MQYLIVYTSNQVDLLLDREWIINGTGLTVSHKFGFGVIDAEALETRQGDESLCYPMSKTAIYYIALLKLKLVILTMLLLSHYWLAS